MRVYAAFSSAPDYTAPPPSLHSLHTTMEGAAKALFPDGNYTFRKLNPINRNYSVPTWQGPDGFGMIKLMEVQEP